VVAEEVELDELEVAPTGVQDATWIELSFNVSEPAIAKSPLLKAAPAPTTFI
jgi:hypothetical protein